MKPYRNKFQVRVLKRLEAGLPPTRWQQLILHLHTIARQIRRKKFSTIWFHGKGILRSVWTPFTVCRIAGVPVQFHVTWLVYPACFLVWLLFDYGRPWKMFFALLKLFVICVSLLAHEFAHVLTARRFGIGSRRVILIPPGAVAELESALDSPNEFWIALACPLASFVLAGIFWLALHSMGLSLKDWLSGRDWLLETRHVFIFGYALNLIMAGFNLLPCFPMDGGRVLRSSLAVVIGRFFSQHVEQSFVIATRIAVRYVSWPVALGMMAYAILQLQFWIYLILFPLLLFAAEIEYQMLCKNNKSNNDVEKPNSV